MNENIPTGESGGASSASPALRSKKIFSTELCYLLGILILALGTSLMERADFGVSMVVAPAYILHLAISPVLPFFSFGMAEYCLQAVLLVLLSAVLRRFKVTYLFSFVTAVLYGFALDGFILLVGLIPPLGLWARFLFFAVGLFIDSVAIALFFRAYITPEAYELFVMDVAERFHFRIPVVKTVYDCCSCLVSIALSFSFFGLWHFEGVKLGTAVCALVNGFLIGRISAFLDRHFVFVDILPWRGFFEGKK